MTKHKQKPKSVRDKYAIGLKKYIDLFNRVPVGIYRTTPDGKLLSANPFFISMLGYDNYDDLEDIDILQSYQSPEDRQRFIVEIEECGEIRGKESVMVRRDGSTLVVEEYATIHKSDDGEILFYEGILIDITEWVKNRQKLEFLSQFRELIARLSGSFVNARFSAVDDLIVDALRHMGMLMQADRSYLFLFDDKDLKYMSNTHEWVAEGIRPVKDELQEIETAQFGWWMDHLLKSRHIIIPDVELLPDEASAEKKIFEDQDIVSIIAVPVFFNFELIGFLGFDMVKAKRNFDSETAELLEIAGNIFANAIAYKQATEDVYHQHRTLENLVSERTKTLELLNEQLSNEIKDRIAIQQDLESTGLRYRLIAENSNDIILIFDKAFNLTYVNPAVKRHFGYSPEEYKALHPEEWFEPGVWEKSKHVLSEIITNPGTCNEPSRCELISETRCRHADGRWIWCELQLRAMFDDTGIFSGVHGILRNIHEKKIAELALWESKNRFQDLVENTSDWLWEVDQKGCYTYCSPMVTNILGYKPEEITGRFYYEFLDPGKRDHVIASFNNFLESRQPFHYLENVALHKNGKKVYLETSGVPIYDKEGNFCGYRGIDRDITESKRLLDSLRLAERKFIYHLQKIPLGYIEFDLNKEVLEWNPAAHRIFGFTKFEAIKERIFDKIVPEELKPGIHKVWEEIIQGDEVVQSINKNITKDGKRIICNWYNTPLIDANNTVTGVACLVQDITKTLSLYNDFEDLVQIFETANDAMFILDKNLQIVQANAKALQLFGVNRKSDLSKISLENFYTKDSWATFQEVVIPVITNKQFYHGLLKIKILYEERTAEQIIIGAFDESDEMKYVIVGMRLLC